MGTQFPLRFVYGRSPHAYVNQRLQIQLGLLMMSDIPLETCWAFNVLWNNKFRYQVASFWLLLLSHTAMHGSMNIKFTIPSETSCILQLSSFPPRKLQEMLQLIKKPRPSKMFSIYPSPIFLLVCLSYSTTCQVQYDMSGTVRVVTSSKRSIWSLHITANGKQRKAV